MKLDNFTLFLIIGVGIIFGGFLITNLDQINIPNIGIPNIGSPSGGPVIHDRSLEISRSNSNNFVEILNPGEYLVGGLTGPNSDSFFFDFDLDNKDDKNFDIQKIYSGILFGNNNISFEIPPGIERDSRISFTVNDTNNYANLLIASDGFVFYNETPEKGNHFIDFTIPETEKSISISIYSEDSWIFWAPTVYDLSNIKIDEISDPSSDTKYLEYGIAYDTFLNSTILIDFFESEGDFEFLINGKTKFKGPVSSSLKLDILKSDLVNGLNSFEFRSYEGKIRGNSVMLTNYNSTKKLSAVTGFSLKESEHDDFKSGRIEFDVKRIETEGSISVEIYNEETRTFLHISNIVLGKNSISILKSNVSPGENIIHVNSVDNSKFIIQDLNFFFS